MKIPIYIIDSFTSRPFGGNPAAVCLLEKDISDEEKQKIATEMNLSETAFVVPSNENTTNDIAQGNIDVFQKMSRFSLRWFTPTSEVPLCGHATLASAVVLFFIRNNQQFLHFETVYSGTLTARRCDLESSVRENKLVEMQLPLNPPSEEIMKAKSNPDSKIIMDLVDVILEGTEFNIVNVKRSPITKKLLVHIDDKHSKDLSLLRPNKEKLLAIDTQNRVRGIIVTVKGSDSYDFRSRYFAPWVGIPEDPVTGSAHTVAPYWSEILQKDSLFAHQSSARGGELWLKVVSGPIREDGSGGGGITIVRGEGAIVFFITEYIP